MKLIEVVVLMGAHCISPVETTGSATEVAKVQCAVVIERDTSAGTVRIVPAGASRQPEVAAVLDRIDGDGPAAQAGGKTIEPAYAKPGTPAAAVSGKAPSNPPAAVSDSKKDPKAKTETSKTETSKTETSKTETPKTETKTGTSRAAAKSSSQCIGEAKPKWYTNAEGRRKYRCVVAD